jgi:hypothetical protein
MPTDKNFLKHQALVGNPLHSMLPKSFVLCSALLYTSTASTALHKSFALSAPNAVCCAVCPNHP